jgi:chromosomal replication initiator protein
MDRYQSDPAQEASQLWTAASQVLKFSEVLTPRDKGWLSDITPEAVYSTTIVLSVSSRAAQEAVQNDLSQPLLDALRLVSGKNMVPAIKIVQSTTDESTQYQTNTPPPRDTEEDLSSNSTGKQTVDQSVTTDTTEENAAYQRKPDSVIHMDQTPTISEQPEQVQTAQTAPTPTAAPDYTPQTFSNQNFSDQSYYEDSYVNTDNTSVMQSSQQPFSSSSFPMGHNRVERDLETHLNKNATFDTFVPGDSNRFARTVALTVAEGSGRDYNPLCIYGSSGLGKTHLLNAIGNYALVKDPNLKVRYVTSEEFTNEFIEALQDTNRSQGQIAEFNRRYRQVDVLLIDDIQFLGGKEATLDQFFHTFNALHDANKRIVIASDVAPMNLKGFEQRLISRFDSGLTVDIKPPDMETRVAILRMMAAMNRVNIPNDVFDLIAERFTENIRELEGALTRVTAVASLNNQPVTRTLAEHTLQDYFATDVEVKPTDIITQVAKYFHLTFDDLVGRTRTKNIALARQIAMYLAREMTSMSLVDIGEVFGGRDHTTVMHAYTRISNEMQEKREIYNYVMELTIRLKKPQTN